MTKPYKLLVFDWDGTLMDSAARIVACFKAAARDVALPIPQDGQIRNFIGIAMREAVAGMFPLADDEQRLAVIERYRHYDAGADETPATMFDGAIDMLQALEREGYFLAVATSKGRRGLDRVLTRFDLGGLFHATRCADEAFSKPHPQMLLDILDQVGVDPHQALMVGDTEYDLLMARNARVDAVGVECGVHERERLAACGPVACLAHTTELFDWLVAGAAARQSR